MSNTPKTIQIDGQEYELVDRNGSVKPSGEYYLRPIKAEASKQEPHSLQFYRWNQVDAGNKDGVKHRQFLDTPLDLTEPQAEALATAIQALVEYVTKDTEELLDISIVRALMTDARSAIQGVDHE